jgi:hypothetical protein
MERDEFAVEILRYLVIHPLAKDTISGIERWWLGQDKHPESRRRIGDALNLLLKKGWLIERCSPQSETIYYLNQNSLPEIKDFLSKALK